MGYELLAVFFVAVLVPLVVLGFIAFWIMTNQERTFIEETWESYAAKRCREYVGARGEWPNRSSPAVRWSSGGIRFSLEVIGVESGARTRLIAWPDGKLLGNFVVRPRGSATVDAGGISDAAFASAFVVSERPRGIAARVLDTPARRALLGFWQRDEVVLTHRRGKLILEWPGRESNDARIDEAERVLIELVRAVDHAFLRANPATLTASSG